MLGVAGLDRQLRAAVERLLHGQMNGVLYGGHLGFRECTQLLGVTLCGADNPN